MSYWVFSNIFKISIFDNEHTLWKGAIQIKFVKIGDFEFESRFIINWYPNIPTLKILYQSAISLNNKVK